MENLTEILAWFDAHFDEILFIIMTLISAASAIAALTPTPKDNEALKKIRTVVERVALNVKHAKGGKGG